jgi:hypothetical protein
MEEKDDIFRFEDFLGVDKIEDLKRMKSNLLNEGLFNEDDELEDDEEVDPKFNPYKNDNTSDDDLELELVELDANDTNEEDDEEYHLDESKDDNEDYYKLFKDKSEDFICDIAVEGVNQSDTEVRLIVESEDWTLMFTGEIKNGKCIIPIKKLNILSEGQTGNIKLEVNADGNLFTPWEDRFIVKVSKKVSVSLNENKSTKTNKPVKKGLGVKVNVKR